MNLNLFTHIGFVEKILFTKHLSVMIKSGISITETLDILKNQTKSGYFKKVLSEVLSDIENGRSLYEALSKHAQIFDSLYLNMVRVGEESGTLEAALIDMSSHLGKQHELRQKVQAAMLYPIIVLIGTVVLGGGISIFILPQLTNFFKGLNVELPLQTKILLAVVNFIMSYGIVVFPVLIITLTLIFFILRLKPIISHWHGFLLHIPIFGSFSRNASLAYFCHNLGVMLKNGIPITEAIVISADSLGNYAYRESLREMEKEVIKGKSLSSSLEKHQNLYPQMLVKMIEVGETSGNLEENLLYLGDFFEKETDNMSKNLPTILEPVLLIIIAFFVGFVALSIISPIYELTGSIQR